MDAMGWVVSFVFLEKALNFKHTFHLFRRVSFLLQVVFSSDLCSPSTSMVMGSSLGES